MIDRNNPYFKQAELLVRILPALEPEPCFAIKGGTAINLFIRELPRLSVDIDLVYLPIQDRETSLAKIDQALSHIHQRIEGLIPGAVVDPLRISAGAPEIGKLIVRAEGVQVKLEVNHVFRGTVYDAEERALAETSQGHFGFGMAKLVSFADLYGSKTCAALDRQHPRDLFDMKLLFDREGWTDEIRRSFLVYLIGHNRPMSELIEPNRLDLHTPFTNEFQGMTTEAVSVEELEAVRERLIETVSESLTDDERTFLFSMKRLDPQWHLLGIEGIDRLPAVQWKLFNLRRMEPGKRARALKILESKLRV